MDESLKTLGRAWKAWNGVIRTGSQGSIYYKTAEGFLNHLAAQAEQEDKQKRWVPKFGENYWFADFFLGEARETFLASKSAEDKARIAIGNCFKTEAEALKAAARVKTALLASEGDE